MNWRRLSERYNVSRGATIALVGLAAIIVALLLFHAGVSFGERRALSRIRSLGGPSPLLQHGFIPEGHGAVGTISAISLPTFTLQARDGDQETVTVGSSTIIRGTGALSAADLRVGDDIIVIGDPSESSETITARFIHILPPTPAQ